MRNFPSALALGLGLLAGCSGTSGAPDAPDMAPTQTVTVAKSDRRRGGITATKDKVTSVADGNNALAFDLYGQLQQDPTRAGKNLFFSPLSLTLALGMTSAGARGQTLAEITKVMHFELPQESLQPALNTLCLQLVGDAAPDPNHLGTGPGHAAGRLDLVHSLWGQTGDTWEAPFLDVLAADYGAEVNLVDFNRHADDSRLLINQWVSDQTEARITDLLPQGTPDASTWIILINAIDLSFPWDSAFDPAQTKQAPFAIEGGSSVQVPLMAQTIVEGVYAEDDLAQYTTLRLAGIGLEAEFFVPKAGHFVEFEAALAAETSSLRQLAKGAKMDLALPRFTYASPTVSLGPAFQALGMTTPFSGGADFSGMTTTEPLRLAKIFHRAMVGIDEQGIQAAAATAVEGESFSTDPVLPPASVRVDHSFFLGMRDTGSGALLFFGRILDPTQT
jgi:serpin B